MAAVAMPHGIPTIFEGIQFRSRLEAQWYAFMRRLGWAPEYEPFDLKNYVPDFVLPFHEPLLVEVKPYGSVLEINDIHAQLRNCGWNKEILVVGYSVPRCTHWWWHRIGWLFDPEGHHEEASLGQCNACGKAAISATLGSWHCRVCGCYLGKHTLCELGPIDRIWAESKNDVQWRRRSSQR